ncbi:MAG: site-specific integrase [Dehalococcoidia bacterium]
MIERRKRTRRTGGTYSVWRVRWRDAGGRGRNRTFDRKADAEAFEAQVKLRKRAGQLQTIDSGKETLADFAQEWWSAYAEPNLERATLKSYETIWNNHALPRLGDVQLRELTPRLLSDFRTELEREGVGAAAVRRTLVMVQGMLQRAVEWERIPSNPARVVRKPNGKRIRAIRPLSPAEVELIRTWLLNRKRSRDATLVSVLAYSGVRPQEALALEWSNVRERTLLVEAAVAFGTIKAQKNRRPPRTAELFGALKQDLAEWRLAQGRPGPGELIFPESGGGLWSEHDWRNWRRRCFAKAAEAVGIEGSRPYDLRHSFASLLIHEGRSVVEVAAQLGHSPTMTLTTYAHVMAELSDGPRRKAEDEIRAARKSARRSAA